MTNTFTFKVLIVEIAGLPGIGNTLHRFTVVTQKTALQVFEAIDSISGYFGAIEEEEIKQSTDSLVVAKAKFNPDKSENIFDLNITVRGDCECVIM